MLIFRFWLLLFCAIASPSDVENKYCDCYSAVGNHPYNFSCVEECYFNSTNSDDSPCDSGYYECEAFVRDFMNFRETTPIIGPKRIVDIYKTYAETAISISNEVNTKFGLEGQLQYTCNLTISTIRKETQFLRKCFLYPDKCYHKFIHYPENFVNEIEDRENYKSCLFDSGKTRYMGNFSFRLPISAQITAPTAVKTMCTIGQHLSLSAIEFPVELKSVPIYQRDTREKSLGYDFSLANRYPSNDIELDMHVSRPARNLHAVHLSWTCPSEWNGFPDFYKIVCGRITHSKDKTADQPNEECDSCWNVIDEFDLRNASSHHHCEDCFNSVTSNLDYGEKGGGGLVKQPYDSYNFENTYLAYAVNWRHHNSTFLIHNCGESCKNQTMDQMRHGINVWWNAHVEQMGLVCTIKAKNMHSRRSEKEYLFGKESPFLAAGKLESIKSQKKLQLKYCEWLFRMEPREGCSAHIMELQPAADDLLLLREQAFYRGAPMSSTDGSFILPQQIQDHSPEIKVNPGCYDWISQRWYFPVPTNSTEQGEFKLHHSNHDDFHIIYTSGIPQHVACIPSKSMILWTEDRANHGVVLWKARVSEQNAVLHVKLTSYTELQDFGGGCSSCNKIGLLVSSVLDVDQTFGDAHLVVISETGIWKISLEGCFCSLVVSSEILLKKVKELSDIVSFAIYDEQKVYLSSRSHPLLILHLPSSWESISHFLRLAEYVKPEIDIKLMDELPGFPSHFLEDTNDQSWCTIKSIHGMRALSFDGLVQVPDDCLFPHMTNGGKVTFEMLSKTTANVTIFPPLDSQLDDCSGFSKPPMIYQLRYGIIGDGGSVQKNYSCKKHHCPCDDPNVGPCRELKTEPTRKKAVSVTIGYLITDQHYIVEVAAVPKPINVDRFPVLPEDADDGLESARERAFTGTYKSKYKPKTENLTPVIAGSVVPFVVVVGLLTVAVIYAYKKRWHMYRNLRRINPSDVKRKKKLGSGHFGEVWEADLVSGNKPIPVAIKILNEAAGEKEKRQFLEEAILLSKLIHPNIVRSLGICMSSKPVILALEFLNGGSLQSFLRKKDVRTQLHAENLLHVTSELCKACSYLEQKGYIHRDISAKNCLISLSQNSVKPQKVKLADFGLAKDTAQENVYSAGSDAVIPVPYTAPEGLLRGEFSAKSDVWSFGVLIWEIFSWGSNPFGKCYFPPDECHMCPLNQHKLDEIELMVCLNKKTLRDLPDPCCAIFSDSLKNLMGECWQFQPELRPSFPQMEKYLRALQRKKVQVQESIVVQEMHSDDLEMKNVPMTSAVPAYSDFPETTKKLSSISMMPAYSEMSRNSSQAHLLAQGENLERKTNIVAGAECSCQRSLAQAYSGATEREKPGNVTLADAYGNPNDDSLPSASDMSTLMDAYSESTGTRREKPGNVKLADAYGNPNDDSVQSASEMSSLMDAYSDSAGMKSENSSIELVDCRSTAPAQLMDAYGDCSQNTPGNREEVNRKQFIVAL